jgi:hypothetical protein
VAELGVAPQLRRDQLAAVAGADDQDLARTAPGDGAAERSLDHRPHEEAGAADEPERQQEVERDDAARRVGRDRRRDQEEDSDEDEARHDDGLQDPLEVLLVHEAPELVVEPEEGEDRELAEDDEQDRVGQQVAVAIRDARIEAQHVRHRVGGRHHAGVDEDLRGPAHRHGVEDARSHRPRVPVGGLSLGAPAGRR